MTTLRCFWLLLKVANTTECPSPPPLASYTQLTEVSDFCFTLKPGLTLDTLNRRGVFNAVLLPVDNECPALGYGIQAPKR